MGLEFLRIDDRLIHGQIVTTWMREVDTNVIIIANDALSKDDFTSRMISLAAPPDTEVKVRSIRDTVADINEGKYEKDKVMILTKTVEDVYGLYESGLKFDYVNVGGMGAKAGTKVIYRNISVTDEQMELLKKMKEDGIEIEFKIVPNEKGMKL